MIINIDEVIYVGDTLWPNIIFSQHISLEHQQNISTAIHVSFFLTGNVSFLETKLYRTESCGITGGALPIPLSVIQRSGRSYLGGIGEALTPIFR